jgi:predicted amidophosphoribosyltransferase
VERRAPSPVSLLTERMNFRLLVDMAFPIKVCAVCSEEFELKPDKPGFANRCPACSEPEQVEAVTKTGIDADERKTLKEANEARRRAMRDLLYRKDS